MRFPASCFLLLLWFVVISLSTLVNAEKDFYEVLEVQQDATAKQIKKAYRKLSLQWHPDKNPDNPDATSKFQEISRAYEILGNEETRQVYDYEGFEGLETFEKQAAAGNQQMDPLQSLFGGGGRGGRPRGQDAYMDIPVTLEELYNGASRSTVLSRNVICRKCRGTGAKGGKTKKCKACNGQGVQLVNRQMGPGFTVQMQQQCSKCGGKGTVFKTKCPVCSGNKIVPEEKTLEPIIERGMSDGEEIRFEKQSEQRPGMTPGDVVFKLKQKKHAMFTRSGNDLNMEMHITLQEALLGFSKEITHLDGHHVEIASSDITIPFQINKIQGEGMPLKDYSSEFGNLKVKFIVDFPKSLTNEQKEQIKSLL
jgi:DnaJ-related protein SCJ1